MITDTRIAWGDQLGAQMLTFANLYYVAKENNQELVLINELKNFRRGYQMLDVFDMDSIRLIKKNGLSAKICDWYCRQFDNKANWINRNKRIYNNKAMLLVDEAFHWYITHVLYRDFRFIKGLKNGVHCDRKLLSLEDGINYNICNGFGTYRDWGECGDDIRKVLKFKKEITEQGDFIWKEMNLQKQTVSVHFRRTDYLVMSSLNLTLDYYKKAMAYFDRKDMVFLVFSDDIEEVKQLDFFADCDVIYMPAHSAGTDMYLMTKCDHNIIANSTFSFWGAYLNGNEGKTVVCPHDFIGKECVDSLYLNGNYYPQNWIAV